MVRKSFIDHKIGCTRKFRCKIFRKLVIKIVGFLQSRKKYKQVKECTRKTIEASVNTEYFQRSSSIKSKNYGEWRRNASVSIGEKHFGIYGWKILQYLGETLWCLWGISLDPCELFTKVSVSFYQITQFDSWFLFTINKCVNTCYHRTQYITVNFWNGPMNI